MAIKLFKRKERKIIYADTFTYLDKLMSEMASTEIYLEYLREREKA
jgi:hypothetical protein